MRVIRSYDSVDWYGKRRRILTVDDGNGNFRDVDSDGSRFAGREAFLVGMVGWATVSWVLGIVVAVAYVSIAGSPYWRVLAGFSAAFWGTMGFLGWWWAFGTPGGMEGALSPLWAFAVGPFCGAGAWVGHRNSREYEEASALPFG